MVKLFTDQNHTSILNETVTKIIEASTSNFSET